MDARGRIVLRRKVSRGQLLPCLANVPVCLIGMEACAGAHHVGRQLAALGHDVRLLPAQYVKPFLKGHKNDYRDAEAIAEAAQRPTMRPVPLKSAEQLDLQALHRVRSRLVGQRTAVINQIRGFLLECGIPVRQGPAGLREALPTLLAQRTDVLSPRMIHLIEDLAGDWRRLDERIETLTRDITALARQDAGCQRLMGIPGVGVITASAMVAAIGTGAAFAKGRDFAAWLGLVPEADLDRRPHHPGWPVQARQPLLAHALRRGRASSPAATAPLGRARLRALAARGRSAAAPECARGRLGQQARAHRLGRAVPRERL